MTLVSLCSDRTSLRLLVFFSTTTTVFITIDCKYVTSGILEMFIIEEFSNWVTLSVIGVGVESLLLWCRVSPIH